MTTLTEEEVYSTITNEDISRSAAMAIIRAYGDRKVIEALEQARKVVTGESSQSFLEAEIDARFTSCLQEMDKLIHASVGSTRAAQETE